MKTGMLAIQSICIFVPSSKPKEKTRKSNPAKNVLTVGCLFLILRYRFLSGILRRRMPTRRNVVQARRKEGSNNPTLNDSRFNVKRKRETFR
jgi:hypothetical protein